MAQDWKSMTGAQAFHLITHHADGWSDIERMMNEWLAAQLVKGNAAHAGSVRLLEAAKQVLSWTDAGNRPPVRDGIECGRSASVRVHALVDLNEAVQAVEQSSSASDEQTPAADPIDNPIGHDVQGNGSGRTSLRAEAPDELRRLREQMERAAIACAHGESEVARRILLDALGIN